ncbi:MAG: hypothetical protein V7K46_20735, partial [Nostoc sp.]
MQQALQILCADEQLSQLEPVMAFFANFVLDSASVPIQMQYKIISRGAGAQHCWCQLKPKPFSNLVSRLWLEMLFIAALPRVRKAPPKSR